MIRKLLSLVFALVIVLSLSACSSNSAQPHENSEENEVQPSPESEQVPEEPSADMEESSVDTEETGSILVAYFSCTGNTRQIAEYAADILGAELYEIVPEIPYTEEDLEYYTGGRADQEQDDPSARPAISGSVENMEQYDTVLIGYPIWHGQAPRIISTFLESYDFAGKTLVPFCTSGSSGIGSSAENLHSLCTDATWYEGERFSADSSADDVEAWLDTLGIMP